jgi:uncharacterized protein YqeY
LSLKAQLGDDMKSAMRARDKERLAVIRMVMAAIKQREIDEARELDDAAVLAVLEKMIKQRRDAENQYRTGQRFDLADSEAAEIAVLEHYLPAQLSATEIDQAIERAVSEHQADSMRDMGKVMGTLKTRLQGQADMAVVSQRLKARLQGLSDCRDGRRSPRHRARITRWPASPRTSSTGCWRVRTSWRWSTPGSR